VPTHPREISIQPAISAQRKTGLFKKIGQRLGRSRPDEEPWDPPPSNETRCYTSADIYRLIAEQRAKHGLANVMPNVYRISQVFRVAGDWLDRRNAQAFDVSFSGQTLGIRYESKTGQTIRESFDTRNLYDLAIQMYLRRAKRVDDSAYRSRV
jgi:hypothetical protein